MWHIEAKQHLHRGDVAAALIIFLEHFIDLEKDIMTQLSDLNDKLDAAAVELAAAKKRDEDSRAALQAIIDANAAGQDLSVPLAKAQALIDAADAIDPAAPVAPPTPPAAS